MTRFETLAADIQKLADPICAELGIEVVQVNINPYHEVVNIQLYADRPAGGIGMEECAALNRRLAARMDSELALGDNYTLEVASPGLDRPLAGYRDLKRVLGRDVQVFLKQAVNGRREITGLLQAVRETDIILQTRKAEILVPMDAGQCRNWWHSHRAAGQRGV